jgi:hypothetical protein
MTRIMADRLSRHTVELAVRRTSMPSDWAIRIQDDPGTSRDTSRGVAKAEPDHLITVDPATGEVWLSSPESAVGVSVTPRNPSRPSVTSPMRTPVVKRTC